MALNGQTLHFASKLSSDSHCGSWMRSDSNVDQYHMVGAGSCFSTQLPILLQCNLGQPSGYIHRESHSPRATERSGKEMTDGRRHTQQQHAASGAGAEYGRDLCHSPCHPRNTAHQGVCCPSGHGVGLKWLSAQYKIALPRNIQALGLTMAHHGATDVSCLLIKTLLSSRRLAHH